MPRQYKNTIVKQIPLIVVEEVILPTIVVEDGYETPDEIGITMPKNITWAPKRKYTRNRNDHIGAGNNKFPKI